MKESIIEQEIAVLSKDEYLPIRIKNLLKARNYKSLEEFYTFYEELCFKYKCSQNFNGIWIDFNPIIKERIAKNNFSCYLSGTKIQKGEMYLTYHPFVEDLTNKLVYVTKREIKALPNFFECFPRELIHYEMWQSMLLHCHENPIVGGGDFYNLSTLCGEDCLDVYPLSRSKKKKIF